MLLQSILSQYVTDDVPEGPWIRFGLRGQKTYLYDKNNLAKTYETMKRSDFEDPFNGQKGYYHFSSSHQELRRIFRTAEDRERIEATLEPVVDFPNLKLIHLLSPFLSDGHGATADTGAECNQGHHAGTFVVVPVFVPPPDVGHGPVAVPVEDKASYDDPVLNEDLTVGTDPVPSISDTVHDRSPFNAS